MLYVSVFSGDSLICTVVHTPFLFKLNVKLPPSKSWYGTLVLCSISLFRLFLIFLPCVSEILARGTVALDDRKVLRCVLPLVLCYVLMVNKWID